MKLLSCIALALAASTANAAWTITASEATRSEDIVGPHQEFTKTWTVSGNESLASLRFDAAGPVFVDVDASLPSTEAPTAIPTLPAATGGSASGSGGGLRSLPVLSASTTESVVAKIVLTGNCTDLLNVFEVVGHDGDVKIHFKNQDYQGYGYVLTQVYLTEKHALSTVALSGDSGVYVGEGVLANAGNTTDISLTISGDGDIFVTAPATDFSVKSVSLKISGDGSIQFNASSVTLGDSLSSKISGDGTIAVLAAGAVAANNSVSTSISGDGNVYVEADEVTAFTLDTKISGEGYVAVSRNGSAVSQDITISGDGTVHTGAVATVDTRVRISGEGNVLVQASNTLRVPSYIEGKVQYVGTAPQQITDGRPPRPVHVKKPKHHGFKWWWDDGEEDDDDSSDDSDDSFDEENDDHHLPKSVTQAAENTYTSYDAQPVPAREPAFLALSLRHNWWGEDPSTHFIIIIGGVDIGNFIPPAAQNMAAAVHKKVASNVVGFGVFAGVAVVAVGVAMRKHAARNRRREYQPLLQVTTTRN